MQKNVAWSLLADDDEFDCKVDNNVLQQFVFVR